MRVGLALAALALAAACRDAPTAPTASVRVDLSRGWVRASPGEVGMSAPGLLGAAGDASGIPRFRRDRKSTRLNSSHSQISYAVFCLKKKKKQPSAASPRDRR